MSAGEVTLVLALALRKKLEVRSAPMNRQQRACLEIQCIYPLNETRNVCLMGRRRGLTVAKEILNYNSRTGDGDGGRVGWDGMGVGVDRRH